MARRASIVRNKNGTVEVNVSRCNGKYLLRNLLACGDCGSSYRRMIERCKVVWRCAARIEEGKWKCSNSPTLDEEWIKKILGKMVCKGDIYDESVIKKESIRSEFSNVIF